MVIICVNCGDTPKLEDSMGSYRYPYCKKCFKKIWNNDQKEYLKFLDEKGI